MSMLKYLLFLMLVAIAGTAANIASTTDMPATISTSTTEPDASPGCKAPDIRFTVVRPETTTEQPHAKFETTQIYLPEDFTTADVDFGQKHGVDMSAIHGEHFTSGIVNPYQVDIDMDDDHHLTGLHADAAAVDSEEADDENLDAETRRLNQERRLNKKRRSGSGRRRRVENDNGESRGRGGRFKRQVIHHDPDASPDTDKWSGGKLAAEGDVYYVYIDDILKSSSLSNELRAKLHRMNPELRAKLHKLKKTKKNKCVDGAAKENCKKLPNKKKASEVDVSKNATNSIALKFSTKYNNNNYKNNNKTHHRRRGDSYENNHAETFNSDLPKRTGLEMIRWRRDIVESQEEPTVMMRRRRDLSRAIAEDMKRSPGEYQSVMTKTFKSTELELQNREDFNSSLKENLQRVKRKSGKTTGALSRPKSGGDSSSKSSTSRKDKGVYEEEGGYSPVNPEETDEEEEEEEIEEEVDIEQQFTEVSEIRFPGEIGPLGDRRLCKIRCVKGKWVGPLCATNEEDDNGNVKFQPLYKSCHVKRIPSHLLLSYRNISVNVGWDLPHGHSLQARCKDLGLYKLLGESRVLCSNGLWAPRMPSCVPTTLLTNFSDDSAPSIRIKVLNGSGAFEPSGVLAVLPHSTILLDCIYPRARGIPEWTWTSWHMQYPTGWYNGHEEKNLRYRLTIKNIQSTDSGSFTCTLPRGLTNNIPIVVTTSTCPQLPDPVPPLTLHLEGNKLGHRAMYRCPSGYHTEGLVNATCLASGNWSSSAPTCHAIQCPSLTLDDPHLSLIELNTSAWGRAVFRCQWGFKLTGPPGLDCEPSGMWSGPVPHCRAIQCTMPVPPLNGRIGGSNLHQRRLTVGALVTFSCNEGHTLVGEPSIICTESGFWSHPPPFCKSQCPYPGDPPNGLIAPLKFNYDAGDYLTVQCRPGFVQYSEHGPPERPKCQPDGNWSGPVPKCRSYEEV